MSETTSGTSVPQSLSARTEVSSVQGDHRSPGDDGQNVHYALNSACDRCHKQHAPTQLMHFAYNGVATLLCFPCLKIVLASLYALPLDIRLEHLRRWMQLWTESEARV